MAAWDELTEAEQNNYIEMFVANGLTTQQGIDIINS